MVYTRVWSLLTPSNDDPAADLGTELRNLRDDIEERINTLIGKPVGTTLADPIISAYDAGDSGTAKTINWANGLVQKVRMTDNCTFTFTNPTEGFAHVLIMQQDATGGRTATLSTWDFGDAAFTPNTGASRFNVVTGLFYGSQYLAGVFNIGAT